MIYNLSQDAVARMHTNYKPLSKDVSLIDLDKLFEKNKLKLISEIILNEVEVKL